MIIKKFPLGPLETNAILIACNETKRAAVIDPALGSMEEILSEVKQHGLVLEKILLTHSHWDHIADVYAFKSKLNLPVYVHALDAGNLERPGSDGIPLFFPIHGVKADGFLDEGMTIELGRLKLEVIHSPGHSPGGVCFYIREKQLLISGDTLFQGSIGNLHLPTANAMQMWNSLEKLSALPAETHVVPGHGPDTTIGQESWLVRAREIFSE
jgi:glyoxylase-like metal-dependent hydrolase (beta-lactamase superfamily II)